MITEVKKQVLEHFAAGRRLYKTMQFQQAYECFSKALEIDPTDGPSKEYVERCLHYMKNPPPPDWDGVFVMETK